MTSATSLDDLYKEDSRISPLFLRYKQIHEIIIISIYLLQASSQTYTIMTYGLLHPLSIFDFLLNLLPFVDPSSVLFWALTFRLFNSWWTQWKIVLKLFFIPASQWRLPNKRVETAGCYYWALCRLSQTSSFLWHSLLQQVKMEMLLSRRSMLLVLVTLLAWLLPTLVIVGGLLDGLFVLHLVEGKATKGNKLMKGKQKEKTSKMQKFLQLLRYTCFYSSTESEPKLWCFLPVMDCHDLLLWSNFFVESRHLVPTIVEFEKLKNFKAENDFDTYIHISIYNNRVKKVNQKLIELIMGNVSVWFSNGLYKIKNLQFWKLSE